MPWIIDDDATPREVKTAHAIYHPVDAIEELEIYYIRAIRMFRVMLARATSRLVLSEAEEKDRQSAVQYYRKQYRLYNQGFKQCKSVKQSITSPTPSAPTPST